MSIRSLQHLFEPTSVAVIGASETPRSVGNVVMRNLLEGGFSGPIMPVHPRHRAVAGVLAYPSVAALPLAPDLAVLCTPPATLPGLIAELGAIGCKVAVVVAPDADRGEIAAAARAAGVRLLGAGSLGVLAPRVRLNASFSHVAALPGKVAFVSQSGALCTAVLDWARPRGIGFSHFVSLGDCADIDFADVMDVLSQDDATRAILLYVEEIRDRRAFMPAARAAARNKPVLVVKAGRGAGGGPCAEGAFLAEELTSPDAVFDAAVRRAGALRVDDMDELFAAVETLARARPMKGDRLAVVSNGGGTAMMAVDELGAGAQAMGAGRLAELSAATLSRLKALLPRGWPAGNPVDLAVDAPGSRYAEALRLLVEAPEVDAVLVIHAPNAMADGDEVAQAVVEASRRWGGAVLTSWMGEGAAGHARALFAEAGLPTYATPIQAVRAFRHMQDYQRNQDMLLQTPPSGEAGGGAAREAARAVIARCLGAAEEVTLAPDDARELLAAYGIPVGGTAPADGQPLMMGIACDRLFGPVVVFGPGGRGAAIARDHALGLPPLNLPLARAMVGRTRVSGLLAEELDAVAGALTRLGRLVVDNPEVAACDLDPVFAHGGGVVAAGARLSLARFDPADDCRRLAVLPYPAELEETACLRDGRPLLLRPIRPEDEPAHAGLVAGMTPEDLRLRFHGSVGEVSHRQLARLTQIDYDREMAFVACQGGETLGEVRTVTDPDNIRAELAIMVRSDLKGGGLGSLLMDKMLRHLRQRGTAGVSMQVLAENAPMLRLARKSGFSLRRSEDPEVVEAVLGA